MPDIVKVETADAPTPAGHYSQGVVHNGLVFVAGQLAIDPRTKQPVHGSIEEQTELALNNVANVLRAANSDLNRLLKVTAYVADLGAWGVVNQVYARVLGDHRPARTVVPTGDLHYGLLIEIEAIAAVND